MFTRAQSLAPILSQMNPVNISPPLLFKIHFNIALQEVFQECLPLGFSDLCTKCPAQPILLGFISLIILDKVKVVPVLN
jgi:hypothetical protein